MTAISIGRAPIRTTSFERVLLSLAASLDRYVGLRAQKRATADYRRVAAARADVAAARSAAEALGSIGIIPR